MRKFLVAIALFMVASAVSAQTESTAPVDRFGRIFSATVRPEALRMAPDVTDDDDPSFRMAAVGLSDSESSTSGSISLGYGTKVGARDVYIQGGYKRVEPESGDGANRISGYGEASLFSGWASISGVGLLTIDPENFNVFGAVLVGEKKFSADRYSVVANLGWVQVDPDGGDSVSDIQPAVGVAGTFGPANRWSAGFDYTFDNDVDGEDTGSFALSHKFPKIASKLKLTVEKHSVWGVSFSRVF